MQSITVPITRQWQIYIPEKIRELLNLTSPGQAKLEVQNGKLIITPYRSPIRDMAGKYHKYYEKNPIDLDNIRDYIDYSDL